MAILARIVDRNNVTISQEAAEALLRFDFDAQDRKRMNRLAARNRAGKLSPLEEQELDSFIQVGQVLGILKSKARRSLNIET